MRGVGTAQDILEAAEKRIFAIRRGNAVDSLEHVGTILLKVYDRLAELAKSDSDISGLSTGLRDLDKFISGLNNSDLMLLAARTRHGQNVHGAEYCAERCEKISEEDRRVLLAGNVEAAACHASDLQRELRRQQKLVTGRLDPEDWSKIGLASTVLNQTDLRVDDNPSLTVAEMNAKCRRLENLGLVIIDYLQLMTAGRRPEVKYGGENRQQVVSDISALAEDHGQGS